MVCTNLTAEFSGGGNLSVSINGRIYPAALKVFRADFDVSDWVAIGDEYIISVPVTLHEHGPNIMTDVYFAANDGVCEKHYGYPTDKGWKVAINEAGDVTIWAPSAAARFAGRLLIL